MPTPLVFSLVALMLASAGPDASEQDRGPRPLVLRSVATGDAYFYSEEVLNLLLQDETAASPALPEVTATEATKVRRILHDNLAYLERRKTKPPFLDEEGCTSRTPGQFSERTDHLLEVDEIVEGARLPLSELIHRAEHVVVLEIVDVMPGLLSSVLESLVLARVEEVLASRSDALKVEDEILYRSDFVDVRLGDVRFCSTNALFSFPRKGSRVLALLPNADSFLGVFNPYGEFRLDGSLVAIHPYPFVRLEPAAILLSDLRKELGR